MKEQLNMHLKSFVDQLNLCSGCGYCREFFGENGIPADKKAFYICPTRDALGFDTYSAKGKIILAKAILSGKLNYSKDIAKVIYACCLCGNCKEHCLSRGLPSVPADIDMVEIFKAMRADIWERSEFVPLEFFKISSDIEEKNNYFGLSETDVKWELEYLKEVGLDSFYFSGCWISYFMPQIGKTTIDLFEKLGLKLNGFGDRSLCCGYPLLMIGNIDLARRNARKNLDLFKECGVKRIITSCPGCYTMLKTEYKKLVEIDYNFEIFHVLEILERLIKGKKNYFQKRKDLKISYHDPCKLSRFELLYEEPRSILNMIPEINFIELSRNKSSSYCCGGGGENLAINPELVDKISLNRIQEVADLEVEILISACPTCERVLSNVSKKIGYNLKIMDISEFILESLT